MYKIGQLVLLPFNNTWKGVYIIKDIDGDLIKVLFIGEFTIAHKFIPENLPFVRFVSLYKLNELETIKPYFIKAINSIVIKNHNNLTNATAV